MKRTLFLFIAFLFCVEVFGQQTAPSSTFGKKDYLKKSQRQLRTGTILLIASPVFVLAPVAIVSAIKKGGEATGDIIYGCIAAGFLAFPVSIGFFIASSASKKKAIRFSFKNETAPLLQYSRQTSRSVPSFTLTFSL